MYRFYRRLFWLRRGSPALFGGAFRALDVEGDCFVYLRTTGAERKLIALNFSAQPVNVKTGLSGKARLALSTHPSSPAEFSLDTLNLRAFEGVILELPD
jgi:hypothetical protein